MAGKQVQFRRGTTTQHNSFTGAEGEVTVDIDKNVLVVHDGTTQGGFPLAKENNPVFTGDLTLATSGKGIVFSDSTRLNSAPVESFSVLFPGTLYIPITEGTRYYAERSISVYEVVAGIGSPSLGENLQFTVSKNGVTVQTFTLISGVYKSLYIFSSTISLVENDYISIEVTSGNGSNLTLKFNYNIVY
jgi:hypothetical protein